ncbi:MAG: ADP-forming succinate--CoA ligase subunit beta [Deltaproteobacteria bacterium]|nr:ADP-forming succinate--CoA ligase subunit beta [Deltaproteobacteria bacterium]
MKIHEYQAKEILQEFGVPVPFGHSAATPEMAEKIAERITGRVAVKAQVHAGGRGKGGGIRLAEDAAGAGRIAGELLGQNLVTPQTGPEGVRVREVLVERAMEIHRELYLAITLDREPALPVILASEAGGMEIEELAARHPRKIHRFMIDPALGLRPFTIRRMAQVLRIGKHLLPSFLQVASNLYSTFIARDCSLVEINPLVVTEDHHLVALDAKVVIDDNSLFRQPDIAALRDPEEEDPIEREAGEAGLSYIRLDGNIGCMVNGAGLAMATMDMIQYAGGAPANFLDVGGAADVERIGKAFRILMDDSRVRGVLINIFGGIVRCDRVAEGVVEAAAGLKMDLPVVVRLEGTNVAEGRAIFRKSGLAIETASDMLDAATKIVGRVT